ncbi:citrate transporter [Trichococcus collinsii]|uniref:Citrate transporter n=1 Tax=Trichococcus collinsii TaxID=157076 RepID=A0AB38A290_9LACT|nr:citrate transporter [Trichococcus collinsii]CZR05399.1 Hypothetical protein Tcol_2282 [Trichococcus collinsii]SEA75486.1 hypothetical protein SAMN04488525_10584 [Trichococcus collinsii]
MKKILSFLAVFTGLSFLIPTFAFAQSDIQSIPAPEGLMAFASVIPIIVILVLLFMKVDMLIAGFVGGVLAMVIGGITLARANELLLSSIPTMLTITVPIINSAIATAVFKSGGYSSALALVRRAIGEKVEYFAAFIVILMAAATYMSGIGGGTAMVLAPLAFAAVGAIPELIAAMCLAAAVSFTTSPASLESSIVTNLTGASITDYISTMRPFWLLFVLIAVLIGFFGAKKRKILFQGEEDEAIKNKTNKELFINTIPAIFLLFAVIAGPVINKAIGMPILGPLAYLVITIGLIAVCTEFNLKQSSTALVEGSNYILTRLFQVGIFITFINIIGETGAFSAIVETAKLAPENFLVPALVIAGYAVGVPAGAYVGTILTLILPIAVSLNIPLLAVGFITMGVGLGSQMSFVNITMQAQSSGFDIPILQVVKGNSKWILASLALLVVLSFVL